MKTSELLSRLQALMVTHGDLDVISDSGHAVKSAEYDPGGEFPIGPPVILLAVDEND